MIPGHSVMAAGMAAMYLLPRMQHPQLHQAGLMLFAALTIVLLVAVVVLRAREQVLNPLWLTSVAHYLAMTYMLTDPALRPTWLSYAFVAYLAGETLAWAGRGFDRLPVFTRPTTTPTPIGGAPGAATQPRTGPQLLSAHPTHKGAVTTRSNISVALTLAVMTASMAYMLAVM